MNNSVGSVGSCGLKLEFSCVASKEAGESRSVKQISQRRMTIIFEVQRRTNFLSGNCITRRSEG